MSKEFRGIACQKFDLFHSADSFNTLFPNPETKQTERKRKEIKPELAKRVAAQLLKNLGGIKGLSVTKLAVQRREMRLQLNDQSDWVQKQEIKRGTERRRRQTV